MWTISKTFKFSASHQLVGLPADHKCSRLHGHNYTVEFRLEGDTLDDHCMVRDFGDLDSARLAVEFLDHTHLNDTLADTTAEYLAMWFYQDSKPYISELVAVRVHETDTCWAEYSE
jgi:6-pyruvoyltetrahydropterin/6-carboxytetrahydropterin synthase